MKEKLEDFEISDEKIKFFKLYLLVGGTPEKFRDLIFDRYQIDKQEIQTKIYRYISCIFELLVERISLEKNETLSRKTK